MNKNASLGGIQTKLCAEAAMEDVVNYLLKSSSINVPGIWVPWTCFLTTFRNHDPTYERAGILPNVFE